MLSLAEKPCIRRRFSDFVILSGLTDATAQKVIELCKTGELDIDRLERWWFDKRLRGLSDSVFVDLIDLQLSTGRGDHWSSAVQMCDTYFAEQGTSKSIPKTLGFRLLTHKALADGRAAQAASYHWSRLAVEYLARYPDRKWEFFKDVLSTGIASSWSLDDLDTTDMQVLTKIFVSDPTQAWGCVVNVFSQTSAEGRWALESWLGGESHRLPGDDSAGIIQMVPASVLFGWVDRDVARHGAWLCTILPKTMDESAAGRLTRNFIARFGKNEVAAQALWLRFHSRGWIGNASDRYRALREEARQWSIGEKDPNVVRWLEEYIDGLTGDIERAEIEEERGH
jgi:hypothetical protein